MFFLARCYGSLPLDQLGIKPLEVRVYNASGIRNSSENLIQAREPHTGKTNCSENAYAMSGGVTTSMWTLLRMVSEIRDLQFGGGTDCPVKKHLILGNCQMASSLTFASGLSSIPL